MKIVKKEDLNLPPAPAQAPQIDWGEDFLAWSKDHQNRYLKKLCSALNHAADMIQEERNAALNKIQEMKTLLTHADQNVATQKSIVVRSITAHNEEKQNLIKRIQELENGLKEANQTIEFLKDLKED